MAQHIFRQVWSSISNLNPRDVRALAEQSVLVRLHHRDDDVLDEMERFFCPQNLSRDRQLEILNHLFAAGDTDAPKHFDLEVYQEGLPRPSGAFVYRRDQPMRLVTDILDAREQLAVPLARIFPPFRSPVIERIIHTVSRENALFSLATALPDIIPNVMQLPWTVGEWASDTAFLTVNQVRMAFLIAAASDHTIGYNDQKGEIGSILAGAFGWRAIARELVGKIPFGGGLIPKAAVAYAGTFLAGRVLERLYRGGHTLTREERKGTYESAFETGKRVARELLEAVKARTSGDLKKA
ncbi:MAG: hypothetical protein HY820_45050 [Acidobacteria bacterium]|nr:hypothetical protein [Acidobacteriota bacterium]